MIACSGKSKLQITAVGDCNTGGAGQLTILKALQDELDQLNRWEVVARNLGHGMATTREGIQLVLRAAVASDIAVINFGLVDAWITSIPAVYIAYYPNNRLKKLFRRLLKFVKRKLRSPWARRFVPAGPVVSREEYSANIRTMISSLRNLNSSCTILLWSTALVENDHQRNEAIKPYNEILQSLAEHEKCLFLDTEVVLSGTRVADRFLDGVHLSDAAIRQIAGAMARSLMDSGCGFDAHAPASNAA